MRTGKKIHPNHSFSVFFLTGFLSILIAFSFLSAADEFEITSQIDSDQLIEDPSADQPADLMPGINTESYMEDHTQEPETAYRRTQPETGKSASALKMTEAEKEKEAGTEPESDTKTETESETETELPVMHFDPEELMDQFLESVQNLPWTIKVNQTTNTVTVYIGEIPVRAFPCSVGADGATPDGSYSIKDQLRWHELYGPCWGQWCEHFAPTFLFHSMLYRKICDNHSLDPDSYNHLGQSVSHGCVRLASVDAKYIYDHVPIGSSVIIFHGTQMDDPLGKPERPFVGDWDKTYDPTDPTAEENSMKK